MRSHIFLRSQYLVAITLCGFVCAALFCDTAYARKGFGSIFRLGKAAGTLGRSAGRLSRTPAEISRTARVRSSIDWEEAGKNGLDVVKAAIDLAGLAGDANNIAQAADAVSKAFADDDLDIVELEACVRESDWLDRASNSVKREQKNLEAKRLEIEKIGEEIEASRANVNRRSQRSVNSFNERLAEHSRRADHYNTTLMTSVQDDVDDYNRRVSLFQEYCNGKSYYDDDLAYVRRVHYRAEPDFLRDYDTEIQALIEENSRRNSAPPGSMLDEKEWYRINKKD